jgi:hypothetical protein
MSRSGKVRRPSRPAAAIRGITELLLRDRLDALLPRGKSVTGSGGEPASGTKGEVVKGIGRADGKAWI